MFGFLISSLCARPVGRAPVSLAEFFVLVLLLVCWLLSFYRCECDVISFKCCEFV